MRAKPQKTQTHCDRCNRAGFPLRPYELNQVTWWVCADGCPPKPLPDL